MSDIDEDWYDNWFEEKPVLDQLFEEMEKFLQKTDIDADDQEDWLSAIRNT